MSSRNLTRLIALAYATAFTVALLVGIDALSVHERGDARLAQTGVSART